MYQLLSFALHVGIKFRKRASHVTFLYVVVPVEGDNMQWNWLFLNTLVETDKSILPAVVRFQDGGKMTFPHQVPLPFVQKCCRFIKSKLKCKQF